ncbi:SCP-like protein, partial [Teladorsagia circumcincta]
LNQKNFSWNFFNEQSIIVDYWNWHINNWNRDNHWNFFNEQSVIFDYWNWHFNNWNRDNHWNFFHEQSIIFDYWNWHFNNWNRDNHWNFFNEQSVIFDYWNWHFNNWNRDNQAQLATGQLKVIGGVLPSTLQMFALKWDDNFLSTLAYYNTIGCQAPTLVPSGVSLSFHASTSVPGNDPKDMIRIVLSLWLNEETGSDLNGQVVYSSQSIKDFANMFYYKSTKVGCSYQTCSATNTMPAMYAVACAFNSAPQLGQPIYPANEGGAVLGCEVDSDCSDHYALLQPMEQPQRSRAAESSSSAENSTLVSLI